MRHLRSRAKQRVVKVVGRNEDRRLAELVNAEDRAFELLQLIEDQAIVQAGRTEREVEQDIKRLARDRFGVSRDSHKRIVRAGANTVAIARENPPVLTILEDDVVFPGSCAGHGRMGGGRKTNLCARRRCSKIRTLPRTTKAI